MGTIELRYWNAVPKDPKDPKHPHGEEFPYSKETRDQLIEELLVDGWNLMLRQTARGLIIWLDTQRFRQS